MELDVLTGRRLNLTPFDVNGDGKFDASDLLSSSSCANCSASGLKPSGGGVITTPTVIKSKDDQNKEFKYASSSTGGIPKTTESSGGQSGRITWREVSQ
jgi:type IV pilus assembly protein PilY1